MPNLTIGTAAEPRLAKCAAESAANSARDGAAAARSEYYTAEEMAEFAKPKKKKARAPPACSSAS